MARALKKPNAHCGYVGCRYLGSCDSKKKATVAQTKRYVCRTSEGCNQKIFNIFGLMKSRKLD